MSNWFRFISTWARFKLKARRLRLAAEWTKSTGPFRQFVYLDEVALRSLIAARYGAEIVSYTESQSTSRQVALSAGVESGVPATVKVDGAGSFQTTSARSREVHRQTTTQSLFAEFLGRIKREGALVWDAEEGTSLPSGGLARGDLIEVKVNLEADPMYRLGATVGEMRGLASVAAAFGTSFSTTQLEAISELLGRLMIGQVPIRAEIAQPSPRNTGQVSNEEKLGDPVPSTYLVATTDVEQYWMDTRRILFGHQEFSVLARVAVDGPTHRWSAVKVMDLIANIVPDLPSALVKALAALEERAADKPEAATQAFTDVLREYASTLGLSLTDVQTAVSVAEAAVAGSRSATTMHEAFNIIRDAANAKQLSAPDFAEDQALRRNLLTRSGIGLLGDGAAEGNGVMPEIGNEPSDLFVEVEIIAIYW